MQGDVATDAFVHNAFHTAQFLGRHFLEVREVKTQVIRCDERTLLLHMGAEHFAQGLVEQVRGRMVGFAGGTGVGVDAGHELCFGMSGKLADDVDRQVVLTARVNDVDGFSLVAEYATVTHLAAHLSVERRAIEHQLIIGLLFLLHTAVTQNMTSVFRIIPTDKLRFALGQRHPVARLDSRSVAGAVFLFLHLNIESCDVYAQSFFVTDQLRQIERESVGVEKRENLGSVNNSFPFATSLFDDTVEHRDARSQRAQERVFLFFHHAGYQRLLRPQFGICATHFLDKRGHQAIHESLFLTEEGVRITYRPAQDATDDVAGLCVGRELAVGDGESDGAEVVGHDAHGDVTLFIFAISISGKFADFFDNRLEHVGVVIRLFALHDHTKPFKAHAGVNNLVRKRL